METNQMITRSGFTRMDLLILAALAVVAAVLLPLLARPKRHPPGLRCFNNLRQVGLAYQQWANDNRNKFPAQVPIAEGGAMEWVQIGFAYGSYLVMSNELNTPKLLICPEDPNPNRIVATTFARTETNIPSYGIPLTNNCNVSYFVGVDANVARPTRLLSGDANFLVNDSPPDAGMLLLRTNSRVAWQKEMHLQKANFVFADGSVQSLKSRKFQEALVKTGMATNRLALP
jgi:prepilin-type processing-associated H-X9-DG protein